MVAQPLTPHSHTFDVSALVPSAKQAQKGWRAFGAFWVSFGTGMALFATYLLLTRVHTSSVPVDVSIGVFLATGLLVVAVSWPMVTEARKYPTAVRVSQSGLVLIMGTAQPLRELRWQDPRMKLGLIDRRGLPPARQDGTPRITFAFQLGRSPWMPITAEAFNAILEQAKEHGLGLSRRVVQATRSPGTYEEIFIRQSEE